ncbi:hypothetical protein FKM82_030232 [Ascaphus truei]
MHPRHVTYPEVTATGPCGSGVSINRTPFVYCIFTLIKDCISPKRVGVFCTIYCCGTLYSYKSPVCPWLVPGMPRCSPGACRAPSQGHARQTRG